VLDTSGDALRHGITAGPAIVKPNLGELRELSGQPLPDPDGEPGPATVLAAAAGLRAAGTGAVVVSLGPAGLLAVTEEGCWRAQQAAVLAGNTTGAGDALAVAVGSSHAMLTRDAVLDLGLIAAIRHSVSVPLVLHGSSGVPDGNLVAAVRAGITKINIATQLNKVFTAAVRRTLSDEPATVDPRTYGAAGREAVTAEVARLLRLLGGGTGEPLSPVE
jgi:Fructose-bisphosphate aldolase class-II/pfkB family carbohydrate kinase